MIKNYHVQFWMGVNCLPKIIVMMLDVKYQSINLEMGYYHIIGGIVLLCLMVKFVNILVNELIFEHGYLMGISVDYLNWFDLIVEVVNIRNIGLHLYNYFFIPFISAGLILLVAMIGAISLVLPSETSNLKSY